MTAALSKLSEAEAIATMTRSQYVGFKLRQDLYTMAWMFLFFWITLFESRSLAYLAATYVFILALARYDHGRKWDRLHGASESGRQRGE